MSSDQGTGPPLAPRPVSTRDHLANERTYLSWVRTGLGMSAFGIAVIRVIESGYRAEIAGSMLLLLGLGMLLYGTNRYYIVRRALNRGQVAERRIGLIPIVVAMLTVIAAVLMLVL